MDTPAVRPDTLPLQSIQLSKQEQAEGKLSPSNRKLAGLLLSCRGYVILRDALPQDYVTSLRQEFNAIFDDCRATQSRKETGSDPAAMLQVSVSAKKQASFWFRKARWRIFPRLTGPMGDPLLLANPFVTPVLEDMLGEDFYCKYVTSDTCENGAILQSPHSDIAMDDVFVENNWQARGYVVNVPVMHCGLHNGPLEVWPGGSHMWSEAIMKRYDLTPNVQDGRNPPVEQVAEYFPALKVELKPGEILIRDLAMWHRGTPNPTDEPRTMMTMAFFRRSYLYGYGDPSFNVDSAIYKGFPRRIQKMFDYHFTLPSVLRRKQRQLRSQVRTVAESWLKTRLGR